MAAEEGMEPRDEAKPGELPPQEVAAKLAELEKAAFDKDARRTRESIEGLLRFIDKDLKEGFTMPAFDDPLLAARFIAGVVETRRAAQDIRHRRRLIQGVTWFTAGWIAVTIVVVFLSAIWSDFAISDKILIVMLSTTTANVLGLAIIVLKGMFDVDPPDHLQPHPSDDPRSE